MNDLNTEERDSQPEESKQPSPPLAMGFGFLSGLKHSGFNKLAMLFLKHCPKYFLKPAILLALAATAPHIEIIALKSFVNSMSNHGVFTTSGDIFMTFGPTVIGLLVLSIVALGSVFWGLGSLLVALTATCRTFLTVASQYAGQETLALEQMIKTTQDEGMQLFRHKKSFLATIWLAYTALMIIPTIVMLASSSVLMLGMPQLGGYTMLPMRMEVPSGLMIASSVALGVSIVVLSNLALILLPVSSLTKRSANGAVAHGLLLNLKTLPAISIYSVILFVLSSLFSSPIDFLLIYNQELITGPIASIFFLILKAAWHIVFFIYLVPISTLLPCEMLRGHIE